MHAVDLALPEPYASAVNRYLALAARSPAVLSVELCGGLENPGLSDLDMLLVVGDYETLRADPFLSLRLLNPEGLSPLFTHGPLVCRPTEYSDLIAHTTLKPRILRRRPGFATPTAAPPEPGELDILTIQAAYVAHLSDALPRARETRHRLLLAGSVKQSLAALSAHASPSFRRSASDRAARITVLRGDGNGASAQREAISACADLTTELAARIRAHFRAGDLLWHGGLPLPQNDREIVDIFRLAFFAHGLGTGAAPHLPPVTVAERCRDGVKRRHAFISSLLESQLSYDVFAAGAEFPFSVPGLSSRIGAKIWARRLLKRVMKMIARI